MTKVRCPEALTDYLASRHNLIDIPDTKTAIQDNLFYRHVYYVLTIPKDFTQSCKSKLQVLPSQKFRAVQVVTM